MSSLAVSSIGKRQRRTIRSSGSGSSNNIGKSPTTDKEGREIRRASQQVLEDLEEQSDFFMHNPSATNLPHFLNDEIELAKTLGEGEFGLVSSIEALHAIEYCTCGECRTRREQKMPASDQQTPTESDRGNGGITGSGLNATPNVPVIEGMHRLLIKSQHNTSSNGQHDPNQQAEQRNACGCNENAIANANTQPNQQPTENPQDGNQMTNIDSPAEYDAGDALSVGATAPMCSGAGCGGPKAISSLSPTVQKGGPPDASHIHNMLYQRYSDIESAPVTTAASPKAAAAAAAPPPPGAKPSAVARSVSSAVPLPKPKSILLQKSSERVGRGSMSVATRVSFAGINELENGGASKSIEEEANRQTPHQHTSASPTASLQVESECCESSTISTANDVEDAQNGLFSLDMDSEHDDEHDNLHDNLHDDVDGEEAGFRDYMATHCWRLGRARYAIKKIRPALFEGNNRRQKEMRLEASVDLACEAKFLSSIVHPNIVRIRGVVGEPGAFHFGIIMDCLQMTLADKIEEWEVEEAGGTKKIGGGVLSGLLRSMQKVKAKTNATNATNAKQTGKGSKQDAVSADIIADKMLAIFDIARAMRYLHKNKIVFRDLKPDNAAFDFRGDIRLFDFGLAKELKKADLRNAPDQYEATGLTGSRRYMAPEVVLSKDYGLSVDVYSFSIVAWEVLTCKAAYESMNADQHFEFAVMKSKRPKIGNKMKRKYSQQLLVLLERMWSANPADRPTFKSICEILSSLVMLANERRGTASSLDSNRTKFLMNQSLRSKVDGV